MPAPNNATALLLFCAAYDIDKLRTTSHTDSACVTDAAVRSLFDVVSYRPPGGGQWAGGGSWRRRLDKKRAARRELLMISAPEVTETDRATRAASAVAVAVAVSVGASPRRGARAEPRTDASTECGNHSPQGGRRAAGGGWREHCLDSDVTSRHSVLETRQ